MKERARHRSSSSQAVEKDTKRALKTSASCSSMLEHAARRTEGILIVAALAIAVIMITGCQKQARPPAAAAAEPTVAGEKNPPAADCSNAEETVVVEVPAKWPPCPQKRCRRQSVNNGTCVSGSVQTAGDMVFVVQRAAVVISADGAELGTTQTDDNGRFVWCTENGSVEPGAKISVRVAKPPFEKVVKTFEWHPGVHIDTSIALEAEGLTN